MLGSLLGGAVVSGKGSKHTLHLRLISQGLELSKEMDERSLADLGFKVRLILSIFLSYLSIAYVGLQVKGSHKKNMLEMSS